MREEVIRPKEVYKGCLYVGCGSFLAFVLIAIGYLIYLFYWMEPF